MTGLGGVDTAQLFYLSILGCMLLVWIFSRYRNRLSTALQHASIWVLIFLGAMLAFGFKDQIMLALDDTRPRVTGDGAMILRAAPDGHFYVSADVNGARTRFLIDTGASTIVLTRADAAAAGITPDPSEFVVRAGTANGISMNAPVRIDRLEIEGETTRDIRALVTEGDLAMSLLGMDFLSRFGSFSFEGDTLVLRR